MTLINLLEATSADESWNIGGQPPCPPLINQSNNLQWESKTLIFGWQDHDWWPWSSKLPQKHGPYALQLPDMGLGSCHYLHALNKPRLTEIFQASYPLDVTSSQRNYRAPEYLLPVVSASTTIVQLERWMSGTSNTTVFSVFTPMRTDLNSKA